MYVVRQPVDTCVIHAQVMVAGNEYLMTVGKVAQPVYEVDGFLLFSVEREVTGVHQYVGVRQALQFFVSAVGV